MEENTTQSQVTEKQGSMKWIGIIVILLLVVGGIFVFVSQQQTKTTTTASEGETGNNSPAGTSEETNIPAMEESGTAQVKEFAITGSSFKFDPAEIRVKKGDTVRIVFTNSGGVHDWVIDEFNASTQQLKDGESETIEFVADQTGTFEYYCSVGQHRQMGMVGNLVVE